MSEFKQTIALLMILFGALLTLYSIVVVGEATDSYFSYAAREVAEREATKRNITTQKELTERTKIEWSAKKKIASYSWSNTVRIIFVTVLGVSNLWLIMAIIEAVKNAKRR